MSHEVVFRKAEGNEEEVAELCSGLVKINSAHPEGHTDECVEYIKNYLEKHGIDNEVHAKNEKKPNIVAKMRGESERKILWVGHMDVVPEGKPENWTYGPYSGEISDGKVWGRGSSDMKGACAAAMVSAKLLSEMDKIPNNVEFWFTSDEEIGGDMGARWLAESGRLTGDICIIGDGNGGGPDNPSIDIGCKGGAQTKIISRGKTAHGSKPYLGDNAVRKLIDLVPYVEKIGEFPLNFPEVLEEPIKECIEYYSRGKDLSTEQMEALKRLYHYPTVTCNIFNGGVKINVIPDYAEAEFDIRLTPGSDVKRVRDRIKELVDESGINGVDVAPPTREIKQGETAGYYESPKSSFAKTLAQTIEQATGLEPGFKILTGGTDGISTSKIAGIPSLGYGTSLTDQAHQPDERITIENLVLGVKVYTAFTLNYKE